MRSDAAKLAAVKLSLTAYLFACSVMMLSLVVNPILHAEPLSPAASDPTRPYFQIELTTVGVSANGRRSLGVQSNAYPDTLTDLQSAASVHKIVLNIFRFPYLVTPDGTSAFLHLPRNKRLSANGTMTVGANAKMTPNSMPDHRILLSFALETQRIESGNVVETDRIDLERVLHENQSQWIGECRQADGSDKLTYIEAHRVYAQAGEAVPVKTQLLMLDQPSPFQSDDPNSDWTAARQTIRVTFMFIDTDEKALMAHFRKHSLGYSPPPSPPPLVATIEDGEDTVVSQSVSGAHSRNRTGDEIRVLPHLKANQTVQSVFNIKEYESDLKHPGADGSAPTIVHTISTARTLPSGGFAVLGRYTTQNGISHEIDVQVEIVPLKRSVAASRHLSPPFRILPSGAVAR